jgi:PAS domain S-box-containing protein
MRKRISSSPIAIVFVAVASLLCILFWLHVSSLGEAKNYLDQRTLSLQTLFIGSLILILIFILFVTRVRLNNRNNKAQAELFISRDWFSKTLSSIGEAVIATDKNGKITFMNKGAETLTGWTLPEAAGKPIEFVFDVISENTLLPVENPIRSALEKNQVILLDNHTILIKKDKTQLIILDNAAPIHNDNLDIIGAVLVFRDVTEQFFSRKRLADSEGLLKAIMDHTNSVIYIKDLEGKFLMINKQGEKILNIKAIEMIGKDSFQHLSKEETEESIRTDAQVVGQKRGVEYEQIIKHTDGANHTFHTSKFPLFDSEGKVYAICAEIGRAHV